MIDTPALLEAFFERSQDGFFFMMLDEPIEWGPGVDKDAALDYVFAHQRMTKVNAAMATQFRGSELLVFSIQPLFQFKLNALIHNFNASLTRTVAFHYANRRAV